jgi:adenine-specific DNA-methyltransferase
MKTGGNKGRYFSPNIDYILVYAKNLLHTKEFRGQISDELIQKVYNQVETEGIKKGEKYRIMGLYQAGLDIRANQRYWIQCPDGTFVIPKGVNFPLTINNGEKIKPTKEDGIWKWIFEKYLEELEKGNIIFKRTETSSLVDENGNQSKWNIYNKIWLNDRLEDGRVPVNLIDKMENRHSSAELKTLEIPFDFAKPTELIKYLMTIVGLEQNDIVLDFFSGSATTGHSTIKYNSEDEKNIRFILVQLPELTDNKEFPTICEIGKERIRRAGEKVKTESGKDDLDIGFKVLKLDSSNIKSWDSDFENLETNLLDVIENIKDGRSKEDLLYEILLKYGLDLTLPIDKPFENKNIYNIGFGALIICLDNNISIDITDEIIAIKKEYDSEITRVVFKDSGFKNATEKTNIIKTLNQNGIDEVVSV